MMAATKMKPTTVITIDLVDKRHIVLRGASFLHGAENHHFDKEDKARKHLTKTLKEYKKEGYSIKLEGPDSYKLSK